MTNSQQEPIGPIVKPGDVIRVIRPPCFTPHYEAGDLIEIKHIKAYGGFWVCHNIRSDKHMTLRATPPINRESSKCLLWTHGCALLMHRENWL